MDNNKPAEPPSFEQMLNQVVTAGLTGGVPYATVVALLEVSKCDVIEMWRAQVRQTPKSEAPLIVPFNRLPEGTNGN